MRGAFSLAQFGFAVGRESLESGRIEMPRIEPAQRRVIEARGRLLELGARSHIVGIVNATPDSFSDGGRYEGAAAIAHALRLLEEGASVVDVGGESTRPGYQPVEVAAERDRVIPVVAGILRERPNAHVSVDTSKASVARAALSAGANWVNDVWGFQSDPELAGVVEETGAGAILMRNGRGDVAGKGSIVDRIRRSWERSVEIALNAGVSESRIVLDPGIGFGTSRREDLDALRGLGDLRSFGFPILLGASRKRITSVPLGLPLDQRSETTLATTAAGIAAGIELFRVHEVAAHVRFASLADLIMRGGDLDE